MTRKAYLVALAVLCVGFAAGCSGNTTPATNVEPSSATLHATVSCSSGESCDGHFRYRTVGAPTWTNGITYGPAGGPFTNALLNSPQSGLTPDTNYEYQFCGRPSASAGYGCVGPDGGGGTTQAFTTPWFSGDYETGNLDQWDWLETDPPGTEAVVTSPVRQGSYAGRFTTGPSTDPAIHDVRAEVAASVDHTRGHEGQSEYYAWSTYIPSNPNQSSGWPADKSWNNLNQWATWGCGPKLRVGIRPDPQPHLQFEQNDYGTTSTSSCDVNNVTEYRYYPMSSTIQYDHWYDFIVHAVWSTSATTGAYEVWMDGQQVVPLTHNSTIQTSPGAYWKQGFYHSAPWPHTNVIYHDGAGVWSTLAAAKASFPKGSPFNP